MSAGSEVDRSAVGVDWAEAEAFYLAAAPTERTFAHVARRFKVSDVRVGQVARDRRWKEKALEVDRLADEASITLAVRTRSARIKKTLGVIDRMLDRYTANVNALELKPSDLPQLVKLAELLVGEPTDRVEVSIVRRVFALLVERAGRFVPAEQRPAFLVEMRELEASLPQEERPALDNGPEAVVESPA